MMPREKSDKKRGMKPTHKGFIVWHVAAIMLYLCQNLCAGDEAMDPSGKTLVDLSHEFNEDTIYWVTTKPLSMTVKHNGTAEGKDYWYQIEEISAGTHGGTHLDAPCHFYQGKWCVSDIPLNRLVVPAVVVDISHHVGDNSSVHLEPSHLISWEEQHGKIPDGSVLMVRTGWARHWPDRLAYTGTTERDPKLLKFPSVKPETAKWLVENRKIVGLGIDAMSVDIPQAPKVHVTLEEMNIYNIENVNDNLRLLPPTGTLLHVMPMKLKGASGAPCRVLATISKGGGTNGAVCNQSTCSITVVLLTCAVIYVLWLESVRAL